MNINSDVLAVAKAAGLSTFQTGGGCDFVGFNWDHLQDVNGWGPCMIITGAEESPDCLTEAAQVVVYSSSEWADGWASFQFKSTSEAIMAVSDQDYRAALLWLSLEAFENPEIVTEKIELLSKDGEKLKDNLNNTMQEYSEFLADVCGFSLLEIERAEQYKKQPEKSGDLPGLDDKAKSNGLEASMIEVLNNWASLNGLNVDCSADEFLIENMATLNTEQKAFLSAYVELWTNSNI